MSLEKFVDATTMAFDGVDSTTDPLFTDENTALQIQCIAHRGSKIHWPENTMMAFAGAIEAGADALETDVHLSKDGVAVLSHDATLKRCYGVPGKVIDYDWAYLKTLRTIKEPHVPMPRLSELVQFLALPENSRIWLMLDIKMDNVAEDVMIAIAEAISSVSGQADYWRGRIQLGCWDIQFVPLCQKHLPGFPITFIGYSLSAARKFLNVPDANFNLLFPSIVSPFGSEFVRKAQLMGREVYVWTVNDVILMRWAISLGVDGIVTDETNKLVSSNQKSDKEVKPIYRSFNVFLYILWLALILPLYSLIFKPRFRKRR